MSFNPLAPPSSSAVAEQPSLGTQSLAHYHLLVEAACNEDIDGKVGAWNDFGNGLPFGNPTQDRRFGDHAD